MNLIRFVSSIMTTYCHDTSWRAPRTASNFLFFCLFLSCNSRLKNSDRKPFVVCVELIGTRRSCDLTLECFGLSGTLLWCIMDLRWKSSRACIYQSIQKFNLWIPLHVLLSYAHLHTSGGCLPLTFECAQNRLFSFLITLCVCGCSLVKSGNGILAGCMGLFVKARMATSIGNTWQFWYVQVPDSMITLARSSLLTFSSTYSCLYIGSGIVERA
jgi:hypothetical protein